MKVKKFLVILSALTLTISSTAGYFPAIASKSSPIRAGAASPPDVTMAISDSVVITANADASNTTADGLQYAVNGDAITITGYTGEAKELVIPETIDGKPVTTIASGAFAKNTSITSVDLGSVTTLGHRIFENCTSLKELTIPKSVTSTDNDWGRQGVLQGSSVETVTFEEGIANIPPCICKNAANVKKVVMPEKADMYRRCFHRV